MKNSQGYTLLFAILITSIMLSVSLSILSIARKEIIISSAATESQAAFYTADTALECGLYWDKVGGSFATTSTATTTITCNPTRDASNNILYNNVLVPPSTTPSSPAGAYDYTFIIPFSSGAVAGESRCASVLIHKEPIAPGSDFIATTIIARGYNVGYNNNAAKPDCSRISTRKVERALQFDY